ncbi:MAG: zf-HC2 domain-containing protein [Candidatus Acidiferrales bacterium]
MADKITTCARFREIMADAADAALSGSLRADFDAHLRDCAACREEFGRMRTLLQAINATLSSTVAAEPSPQLLASVRQRITEQPQPHRTPSWLPRSAWLTTAGASAALAILLFAVRTTHKFNQSPRGSVPNQVASLSTLNQPTVPPTRGPIASTASTERRKSATMLARHSSPRTLRYSAPEPEVIVEPGQMQAIFQLVGAAQRGQIDGAELLADEEKVAEPLEIKPLTIAPLQIVGLKDESGPSASGGSRDDSKDFVNGRSN